MLCASVDAECCLGIGLSAKFVEKGGADLIIIYNSGRFRMAGRGSLAGMMPYGDANATVLDMVSPLKDVQEMHLSGSDRPPMPEFVRLSLCI